MNPAEKQELLLDLTNGRAAFLQSLEGLSEQRARQAPEAGRWSVLECVEHVVLVEDYLFTQILAATDAPEPVANPERERRIRKFAPSRALRRVPAPEVAIPSGRYPTIADAALAFSTSRDRTIQFLTDCREDLRARLAWHPILGQVNVYETLLMMAAHPWRHADQVREIRSAVAPIGSAASPSC